MLRAGAMTNPMNELPVKILNSTDATQHEPLAVRARTRRAELVTARDLLPADEKRVRGDIELALSTIDSLLTGDPAHPSDVTGREMNTWLEHTKHLAETPTTAPTLTLAPTEDVADAPSSRN